MSFKIITDSCANLTEELYDRYDISVLPLTFIIDGQPYASYVKEKKTELEAFYKMMRDEKLITTSQPSLDTSQETIEAVLKDGYDVLYLGFSSGLSTTYQSVDFICQELGKQYPERKIITVDTLAAALGQGLLVWMAAEMREEGKTMEEIAEWVEDHKLNLAHWFTVDDLHYLERGGRVSKTAAFAATMLNIKPVLHVDDEGHLIPMEKVRGRKKSFDAIVKHMNDTMLQPYNYKVIVSHGDCEDEAQTMAKKIKEETGVDVSLINCLDPVIGAHSGPGTMAVFFLADHR
ncbi:MAG: DegV family protein [Phoenicibacter congonensis]|uniref:DegV family protein n=1 Tax=Phoenicibacter congonensis TaxID=1944646 RepID=A0AA43RGR6_9ACTN|nr:DegV family protein [Phoenicibacter congonensis]